MYSWVIHLLFFWILGPLIIVFVPCTRTSDLLKNMGFIPSRQFFFTYVLQIALYLVNIVAVYILVMNRLQIQAGEEEEALEIYMLSLLTLYGFQRYVSISIKYATFPKVQWHSIFSRLTVQEVN